MNVIIKFIYIVVYYWVHVCEGKGCSNFDFKLLRYSVASPLVKISSRYTYQFQ